MGSLKKIIWSLMTLVLFLVGGLLASLYFVDDNKRIQMVSKLDDISYRQAVMVFGFILILFAVILIIDILIHKNEEREYLIESNTGDVYITNRSLEAAVQSSVNQFSDAKLLDTDVKIIKGEEIKADIKCDVFAESDFETLGTLLKEEVANGLRTLTGIDQVDVAVQLNKAESAHVREIR